LFARSDENVVRWERRFEIPMLVVAGLVIPSLLLDQPGVGEPWRAIGVALNWLIWIAFLLELVVVLAVSPHRWRYLRHDPLDLLIVVLTPPFLTSVLNGVRLLRLVRVARLVRLSRLLPGCFAAAASGTPPCSRGWSCWQQPKRSRSRRTPAISPPSTGR
jgi:hypothetical protein